MKTIEQLLELRENPYYIFTPEEQKALDDFLSKKRGAKKSQKHNSKTSEKNIPATVVNKNIVQKETGVLPTSEQVETSKALAEEPATANNPEVAAVEEAVHPDAVK